MARKESRYKIVGQTIEELIPYHDGATIILSNGLDFDLAIEPDEFSEPKHPAIVNEIGKLEGKLYDVTYRKKDKEKQKEYKSQLKKLKNSLIDKTFTFNQKPCIVKRVISTEHKNSVIIDQDGSQKEIYLYSLEK